MKASTAITIIQLCNHIRYNISNSIDNYYYYYYDLIINIYIINYNIIVNINRIISSDSILLQLLWLMYL